MKRTLLKISISALAFALLVCPDSLFAQTSENTPKKNFGYSQNPKTKPVRETKSEVPVQNSKNQLPENQTINVPTVEKSPEPKEEKTTIAQKTLEVVRNASKKAVAPTENYLVGIGDVLFISLQNNNRNATYFTVLNDGTIDYPLAGEMVQVAGLNAEEIEELLTSKIKLYENPQVSVKVREFNSHRISVLGLVEKSGEKSIQREAVPLFVVRAEAIVQPNADRVLIRRTAGGTETYDLKDEKYENVLIFPKDIVEFISGDQKSAKTDAPQFIFIGGNVLSGGKIDFHAGLTLTQAILVAGGLKKEKVSKVLLRRKNADGLLVTTEFDLKLVKAGKIADPTLEAGDVIEIGN